MEISIGILAWKSGKTLKNTLKSYKNNGLLEISNDITILFQEITEADHQLAKAYKLPYLGLEDNIGIGNGILKLIKNAKYDNFLFLEHDWELIENKETTQNQIKEGLKMLEEGFDVVRFRHRKRPGFPLYSKNLLKGNELEYYDDWHEVNAPQLLESLHWLDPSKEFPDKIQKQKEFFITTSRWANWTNNPFLIKNEFYLNNLASFGGETVDLERKIAKWWSQQNFKIAQGEGLFMHNDFVKYQPPSSIKKLKKYLRNLISF